MSLRAQIDTVDTKKNFFLGLIVASTGIVSPPIALAAGLCFGLLFLHPLPKESGALAKTLLQLSVVALGFGINLSQIIRVGRSDFLYTALGISASILLGLLSGRAMRVENTPRC